MPRASIVERPEWHVSINDVPIGPVRLEEMAHKIDAGAVSEYSLVWREGFDEWRPLATVPELMALLHERRHSGPPLRSAFSSMPPFVDSHSSGAELLTKVAPLSPPSRVPGGRREFAPLSERLQSGAPGVLREVSQPPAPIGPSAIFQSSPPLGSFSGLPAAIDEDVSIPSVPPPAAVAPGEPRRGLSVGALAMIVAVAVFSAVVAFLAFDRFGERLLKEVLDGREPPVAVAPPVRAVVPTPPQPVQPKIAADGVAAHEAAAEAEKPPPAAEEAEAPADIEAATDEDSKSAPSDVKLEPPNPADDGPKMAPREPPPPKVKARRSPGPESVAAPPEADSDSLSAEDQKLLADFGSSTATTPAKIDVARPGSSESKDPPLDGDAVRTTVAKNKPRLQRCYERAIRGQQAPSAARLDVTVTVVASGRVKEASALGSGPGGLAECVEASVRRWRFPSSSEGGPAKFPLVFSPGN